MPITWRNVEGDQTRGAAMLFETARRAFGDGFGNFQGIIDSKNQVNQQNWDTQKEVNTDQFLDRLAQYKTPEELAAAQQAGGEGALAVPAACARPVAGGAAVGRPCDDSGRSGGLCHSHPCDARRARRRGQPAAPA